MSTHLVCPVCGKPFECGPHEGDQHVLSPIQECPVKKGALYVFVKDDRGDSIPKAKTYCGSNSFGTDSHGYAFYEQLDADKYPTKVVVEESDKSVSSNYYAVHRTSLNPAVQGGKITMVEFVLHRFGDMLVKLERTDGKSDLPRASFQVSGLNHSPDPSSKDDEKGQASFPKLKPTESYSASCALSSQDDLKNFKLVEDQKPDQKVKADQVTEVIFKVDPRFWIDLSLVDQTNNNLTGQFALKQDGKNITEKDVGGDIHHVPDLQSGKVEIEEITLSDSREFVSLS